MCRSVGCSGIAWGLRPSESELSRWRSRHVELKLFRARNGMQIKLRVSGCFWTAQIQEASHAKQEA